MSTVYLIHFDRPLEHARHYIGWAQQYRARLAHHRAGSGARILQVCNELGISYKVVRTWDNEDRNFERKLKNRKEAPKLCPICNPEGYAKLASQPGDSARARKPDRKNKKTEI